MSDDPTTYTLVHPDDVKVDGAQVFYRATPYNSCPEACRRCSHPFFQLTALHWICERCGATMHERPATAAQQTLTRQEDSYATTIDPPDSTPHD
jgi:hypothetical protein